MRGRARRWLRRGVAVAGALLAASSAFGQAGLAAGAAAPQMVTDVLQQMSERAAVIFLGQVLAVKRAGDSPGTVEVDFRVDRAIRGCSAGEYTLHEWAGLWAVDQERYHVGDRLLMLLHAPGAAGLSSPVDGLDGAIPVRQGGSATPYAGSAAGAQYVDLRWLGARLARGVSYRREDAGGRRSGLLPEGMMARPEVLVAPGPGVVGVMAVIAPVSGDAAGGSIPAQQASVGAVLEMLEGWERTRHAGP